MKGKSLSCVRLFAIPWTAAYQAPLSMGFSRQEYWSGVPLPSPFQALEDLKALCGHLYGTQAHYSYEPTCRIRLQEQALTFLPRQVLKKPWNDRLRDLRTRLVVQQLRLHAPSAGGPGSVPSQGTKSHRPQPRVPMPQLRPGAAPNKIILRERLRALGALM